MSLQIDAALNPLMEDIGREITQRGMEDSSGLRRCLSSALAGCDFPMVARVLSCTEDEAAGLRQRLVIAHGDPDDERAR